MLTIVAALALTAGLGFAQIPGPGEDFTDANLTDYIFDGLDINSSIFLRANVQDTQFVDTILTDSDFTDAMNVPTANFTGAFISGTILTTTGMTLDQLMSTGSWTGNPGQPDLSDIQLPTGLIFTSLFPLTDANLVGTNFTGTSFPTTSTFFSGAIVENANFSGTGFSIEQLRETKSVSLFNDIRGMTMASGMGFENGDLTNPGPGDRFISMGVDFRGVTFDDMDVMDGTTDIRGFMDPVNQVFRRTNFKNTNLTVEQLVKTGTWKQVNPVFFAPGFDPDASVVTTGNARSLYGVTLKQGMDLSQTPSHDDFLIPESTALDFRGTDFNGADLTAVDLTWALFDKDTILKQASTTVYVSDDLMLLNDVFPHTSVALAPSVLEVKDSLTITDGVRITPAGTNERDGRLDLNGGILSLDPGDVITTEDDIVANGIRVQTGKTSTILVSRDSDMETVIEMKNPIYFGGPQVPALTVPVSLPAIDTVLNITAPSDTQWGVLSLNGDVTFEGSWNITDDARVQLMGDYIPQSYGIPATPAESVEANLTVDAGGVLMGTGTISMTGIIPGTTDPSLVTIGDGGTFAPGMVVMDGPDAPVDTIGGKMRSDNKVIFEDGSALRVMIADANDVNGVGVSTGMIVKNDVVFGDTSLEVMVEGQQDPSPPTAVGPGFITEERSYLAVETLGEDPLDSGFDHSITGQPSWVNPGEAPALLELAIRMEDESGDGRDDQMWFDVQPNGNKFSAFAWNHNQRTIANALDKVNVSALPANEQQDANTLLGQLQWLSASELSHQMQLLAGVEGVNNGMATLQSIRGITDRTHDYLYQMRRAARKNNVVGTETVAVDEAADADAAAALQAMSHEWHIRVDAIGIWGNVDNDGSSGSYGYSYDSYGFNLAIEREFAPNLFVGMTLAGFTTDLDGQNGSGDAESDTLFLDLHATYSMGDFYINAQLIYAHSWIDTHHYSIGGRRADGNTESNYYGAVLEFGYNMDFEALNVEPYLRLDYAYSRTDGYNDHNGGAANTRWDSWSHNSFRSSLGTRLELPFSLASMPARVRGDFAWEHEFADRKADAGGQFLGIPVNVQSADLGRDAVRMGVEMELDITDDVSLSTGYQFRGNHDWTQHMVNLTLKCAW
jgi:outer membrane autotransporter protein